MAASSESVRQPGATAHARRGRQVAGRRHPGRRWRSIACDPDDRHPAPASTGHVVHQVVADKHAVRQFSGDGRRRGVEDAGIRLFGAHGGRKDHRIQEAGQAQLVEHERQQVAVVAEDANPRPRRSDHVNGRERIWKHPRRKGLAQFGGHVINVEIHGGRIAKLIHVDTGVGEFESLEVLRLSARRRSEP